MAKTGYEDFGDKKPLEHHVELPIVADTSVETAIEIDTGLAPGMKLGWALVGMDWSVRDVAAPHYGCPVQVASDASIHVQLCRGDVPDTPVLLDPGDHDLIYDSGYNHTWESSIGVTHFGPLYHSIRKPERTQMEALYLMMGTDVDIAIWINGTHELFAILYYFLVTAPEIEGHNE